jgi:hypothetical protein
MQLELITPYGFCQCGCGGKTTIATQAWARYGWVKGEPKRYIYGHAQRAKGPEYLVEDRGYETPCWVWQRYTTRLGYGARGINGRVIHAHRHAYQQARGVELPIGTEVHHLCRVRACVNPDHLVALGVVEHRREDSKLSLEIAREIRRRHVPRVVTRKMLAAEFGVGECTVKKILAGQIWCE